MRTLAVVVALGLASVALAGQGDLWLRKARLKLKAPKPGKAAAHTVSLKGEFAPGDLTRHVDPRRHDFAVRVDGTTIFALPAADLREGLVGQSHGRWKYRDKTAPRRRAARLTLDLSLGRFTLRVKDADLTALVDHGRENVLVELVMRGQVIDATPTFSTSRKRWSFRQGHNPHSPGENGSMPAPDPEPEPGRITPFVIAAGSASDRTIPLDDWAADQAKWRVLWAQHSQSDAPFVDFETEMVIGVFLGARPTGGHTVVLEQVTADGQDLAVRVLEGVPGTGCVVTQAFTNPYVLVRVPRHTGSVSFTRRVEVYTCDPNPR